MGSESRFRIAGSRIGLRPLLIFLSAASIGCGINTRKADGTLVNMTQDEFAEYVEQVFRHHNGVLNELILATSLSEDPDLILPTPLIAAEKTMAAKCQPLNDMVSATIEGRELSTWSKLLLIDQVPSCAEWSQRVEELIEESF